MWTKKQSKTLHNIYEEFKTLDLRDETLEQITKLLFAESDYKTEQKIERLQTIIKIQKYIIDVMGEWKDKLEVVKAKKSIIDILNKSKGE